MGRLAAWFRERFPVGEFRAALYRQARKPLPRHVSWWHTFGSLALFLLANQVVTGVLLMVYYRPTPEAAFESLRYVTVHATFGWLIRGLHTWGAHLLVVVLVLHMLRTFLMGAFKKPRELTWVVGVTIFATVLGFAFTGSLLPWNQLAYWATTVGTEVAGAVPLLGDGLKLLLRGGEGVSEETLARFYVVHVVVLPWVVVALVGLHLFLVRLQGITPREPVGSETPLTPATSIPFWPDHVLKELTVFPLFLLALVSLVVLLPPEVGERADPLRTPEGVKPEWYFLPTYQLLKYFPKLAGLLVVQIPILLLLLWPFLDRTAARRPRGRPVSVAIGVAALALAVFFGLLGFLSERTVTVGGAAVHFDTYGIPRQAEPGPAPPPGG
ncbi:MAG: cytochrome bc complex cytochrome b subunit [Planctomycetales bacterium]|nr:cytochrome bc complex cytochrome b subunit [Planctomycetales bacterium]